MYHQSRLRRMQTHAQGILEVVSKPHLRLNSPPASPERLAMAGKLRCKPLQNAHILPCMLRFFIGLRLALEPNLRF
jgi:hypothetical protein